MLVINAIRVYFYKDTNNVAAWRGLFFCTLAMDGKELYCLFKSTSIATFLKYCLGVGLFFFLVFPFKQFTKTSFKHKLLCILRVKRKIVCILRIKYFVVKYNCFYFVPELKLFNMDNQTLTRLKVEFADANPKEFAIFLSTSESDAVKELRLEAMSFYLSHSHTTEKTASNATVRPPSIKPIQRAASIYKDYNPNITWLDKIKVGIASKGGAATTNEIVDFVLSNEQDIDRDRAATAISTIFSRDKGKEFTRLENDGRGYKYKLNRGSRAAMQLTLDNSALKSEYDPMYNPQMTWKEKITYLIAIHGGNATSGTITRGLMLREPESDKKVRENKIASMSSVLSQNAKDGGMFTKRTDENGAFVYSMNEMYLM
jgi:hypothetical protein